ncbi:MAG: DUF6569 family protein [bacterium]
MTEILKTVAGQERSWRFGAPWRVSDKSLVAVMPILHDVAADRGYRLLSEAAKDVAVHDTGNISAVTFDNKGGTPVFIRVGEMVAGGTQTRVIVTSSVLFPGSKLNLEVRCGYASRGIARGAEFREFGTVSSRAVKGRLMERRGRMDQVELWDRAADSVQFVRRQLDERVADSDAPNARTEATPDRCVPSARYERYSHDDLESHVRASEETLDRLFEKMPAAPTQTGLSLLSLDGCDYLEFFDHADSWRTARKAVLASEAELATRFSKEGVFQFNPEFAVAATRDVLLRDYTETELHDDGYRLLKLDSKDYTGEVVEIGKSAIHVAIARKTN